MSSKGNAIIKGLLPLFVVVCVSLTFVCGVIIALAAREGTGPTELLTTFGGSGSARRGGVAGRQLYPTYTPQPAPTVAPSAEAALAEQAAPVDGGAPASQPTEPSAPNASPGEVTVAPTVEVESQPQVETAIESSIRPGSSLPERPATRLVIPKMNLDVAVVLSPIENQTWKVDHLGKTYVGHLEGTASPGDPSNVVLAGHVTIASNVYGPFAGLGQLQAGDPIVVYVGDQSYTYIVDYSRLVERTAVDVAFPTDTGRVTLITCSNWSDELGVYQERLIVVGHLVDEGS